MNALMSARPRRGSCSEYFNSMSGAAISSMTPRLTLSPQNSVNQRPTTALLSSCLLIRLAPWSDSKIAGVASDRERLRLIPVGQTPLLVVELQVCSRSLHERYRANSSSRRQSAGSRRSLRLVTQSSSPCCCGGCPYHVDRGAGARPNCRARDATSTSDTDLGSR